MGGIYVLGIQPGTRIIGNLIRNIVSRGYGGWGLYFDEGASDIDAEQNLIYNTKSGEFHIHFGENNIIKNNILAYGEEAQIIRTREENRISFRFENNIILWKNGNAIAGKWINRNWYSDNNCWWCEEKPVTFDGLEIKDWQESGSDRHSLFSNIIHIDLDSGAVTALDQVAISKINYKWHDWGDTGLVKLNSK